MTNYCMSYLYDLAAAEAVCGNMVVEEGEECDCGYQEDKSCKENKCCQGRSGAQSAGGDCELMPEKTCRLVFHHYFFFKSVVEQIHWDV